MRPAATFETSVGDDLRRRRRRRRRFGVADARANDARRLVVGVVVAHFEI